MQVIRIRYTYKRLAKVCMCSKYASDYFTSMPALWYTVFQWRKNRQLRIPKGKSVYEIYGFYTTQKTSTDYLSRRKPSDYFTAGKASDYSTEPPTEAQSQPAALTAAARHPAAPPGVGEPRHGPPRNARHPAAGDSTASPQPPAIQTASPRRSAADTPQPASIRRQHRSRCRQYHGPPG